MIALMLLFFMLINGCSSQAFSFREEAVEIYKEESSEEMARKYPRLKKMLGVAAHMGSSFICAGACVSALKALDLFAILPIVFFIWPAYSYTEEQLRAYFKDNSKASRFAAKALGIYMGIAAGLNRKFEFEPHEKWVLASIGSMLAADSLFSSDPEESEQKNCVCN